MRNREAKDPRGRKPKITDAQIKKAYAQGIRSAPEIANKYNVSSQTIRRRIKEMKMEIPDSRGRKSTGRILKVLSLHPETIKKVDYIARRTGDFKGEVVEKAVDLYYNQLDS